MKLYWAKHTCAIGIHVILEEIGAPFELQELNFKAGEHKREPFAHINPKGKVPTLVRNDGSVLTEYSAIASFLATAHRDAALLPFDDLERMTRLYETMDYIIGTIHGQAFRRMFRPEDYAAGADNDATLDRVKAEGRTMAEKAFGLLAEALGDDPFVAGKAFSIGDTALFYAARWAPVVGVTLPGPISAHLERIKNRPTVAKVLEMWGES